VAGPGRSDIRVNRWANGGGPRVGGSKNFYGRVEASLEHLWPGSGGDNQAGWW